MEDEAASALRSRFIFGRTCCLSPLAFEPSMPCRLRACLVLFLSVAYATPAAAVDLSRIPGYTLRRIQGFPVLINAEVLRHDNDPRWQRKPTEVLEHELRTVAHVLPERSVRVLRTLTIWVEWDDRRDPDAGRAVAKYYGVLNRRSLWRLAGYKNPLKANNIEIINMRALTAEHQPRSKADRCVLLHEMIHAVHIHRFGPHNAAIRATYRQAMERHLYDQAKDVRGRTVRPYAGVNEAEYFAEISCAFLNKLHYYPFDRNDLMVHDPAGYQLMVRIWGQPEALDAVIRSDAERAAGDRLTRAKHLSRVGRKDEALAALKDLIETYPDTKAAKEGKELRDQLAAANGQGASGP
jgi:hypothetical protein